jgi:hypothetical protein
LARALTLLLLLAAPAALRAETRGFRYQLLADNRATGTREVKLNYLPGERGEVVTVEAWTDLAFGLGGSATYRFKQRLGGRFGGSRSFTSSVNDNGVVREVQGQVEPTGAWSVIIVEGGQARQWSHPADAIDLNSAELLDPERGLRTIEQVGTLRVLVAETGRILTGPLEPLGTKTVQVGSRSVQVRQFRWSPPEATMVLSYDVEGLLVSYETSVAGRPVAARLNALPAPRSYEETFSLPLDTNPVGEEGIR